MLTQGFPNDFSYFLIGDNNLKSKKVKKYHILTTIIHEDWKVDGNSYDADIALVALKRQLPLEIVPACLYIPTNNSNIIGKYGTVLGWGLTENNSISEDLPNELKIKVIDNNECLKEEPRYKTVISNRTLCVGNNDGTGVCSGDSGSGLFVYGDRNWYVAGLVSASLVDEGNEYENKPLCDVTTYSVFTDISKYRRWIEYYLE